VVPLCLAVPGTAWWLGTRSYDFVAPPTATELEKVRVTAVRELAEPRVGLPDPSARPQAQPPARPEPAPPPPPPPPRIEPGPLVGDPPLEAWADHAGKPPVSFIHLASDLEANTELAWALPAWERVLDHCTPDDEQRSAALNAIRRLRATVRPPDGETLAPIPLELHLETPADRLKLTQRAAEEAAAAIRDASAGQADASARVVARTGASDTPMLRLDLHVNGVELPGSSATEAPESAEALRRAILSGTLRLVASQLALQDELSPVTPAEPGEEPADALRDRVTRLAWRRFLEGGTTGESP